MLQIKIIDFKKKKLSPQKLLPKRYNNPKIAILGIMANNAVTLVGTP
jgi:hypothetical protein